MITTREKNQKNNNTQIYCWKEKETNWDTLDKVIEEHPDDTFPVDTDESINDINDDKNEKNDEEKDAECPDDTSPVDMEDVEICPVTRWWDIQPLDWRRWCWWNKRMSWYKN